jgi:hypothetical protein
MVHALSLLWHSVNMRRTTSDNDKPWSSGLFGWPKIRSFDPSLTAVWTAHPSQPLLALFDPPVELASSGPRGCLNLDGRIHFPTIRFAVLTRIEIPHVSLEHAFDSGGRGRARLWG